ncbi:MAG: TfoX/Sxy family protein [Burkholderiales bacterium]
MANSKDYVAYVLELMRPAGAVSARAMFGGHGIYVDAMIVGLVVDDVLYLKTDDLTREAYAARGLPPFRYATRNGDVQVTSYHRPPDEALESPAEMREWLRLAVAAALRGASRRPVRRKPARAAAKPRRRG